MRTQKTLKRPVPTGTQTAIVLLPPSFVKYMELLGQGRAVDDDDARDGFVAGILTRYLRRVADEQVIAGEIEALNCNHLRVDYEDS